MKSFKMFGTKIPIQFVFLATVLLVSTVAIAVPVKAVDQTVTGETLGAYTISMTVAFGQMPPSSNKEITGIITATYDANIGVSVADSTGSYTTGVLTKLEYDIASAIMLTIDAPGSGGIGSYTLSGSSFSVSSGDVVDLTAYSGAVAGVWDPIVITLTITPT